MLVRWACRVHTDSNTRTPLFSLQNATVGLMWWWLVELCFKVKDAQAWMKAVLCIKLNARLDCAGQDRLAGGAVRHDDGHQLADPHTVPQRQVQLHRPVYGVSGHLANPGQH